jgi:peptide/nickel transport system substrate-binding protein
MFVGGRYFRIAILGGLLLLLIGTVGACAGDDDSTQETQAQPAAAQSASSTESISSAAAAQLAAWPDDGMPQYGGQFRTHFSDLPSLTIMDNVPAGADAYAAKTHSTLTWWDFTTDYGTYKVPTPHVAKSWDISGDGTVWTFNLRDDVTFHDGTPLTSADVKATLEHFLNPGDLGPPGRSYVQPYVNTVETPDPYTVILNLKGPTAVLPLALATTWVSIVSEKDLAKGFDWFKTNENGSGPWIFDKDEWDKGISYQFSAYPDNFEKGLPFLDTYKAFVISGVGPMTAAFETKRIDDVRAPSVKQTNEIMKKHSGVEAIEFPGLGITWVQLNVKIPPFDDPLVRKAVYYWLDRDDFLQKGAQGRGYISEWINPDAYKDANGVGYGTSLKDLEKNHLAFNPDKTAARKLAKELLAEAGLDPGTVTVRVVTPESANDTVLVGQLEAMGFKVSYEVVERAASKEAYRSGDFGADVYGSVVSFPAPEGFLNRHLSPKGQRNYTGIEDPKLQKMIDAVNVTVDANKRRQLLNNIDQYLQEGTYPMILLRMGQTSYLRWDYVRGRKHMFPTLNAKDDRIWLKDHAPGRN